MNPPDYLDDIEDGSPEDQLDSQAALAEAEDSPYHRALKSTTVIPEFDNQWVRIPGFIVPLDFDDQQKITSFFLVPFFGACIHLPPPPPNQMIYASFEEGITVDVLYDAFWVTGLLQTTLVENELASSAYVITVTGVSPYEDD